MAGTAAAYAEAADRAEARAERLQLKIDEERALSTALRRQLRESSETNTKLQTQLRTLQGAPGANDAAGGSLSSLQRQVARLRDQLDVEKKAANAAVADRDRLERHLATAARERQTLLSSNQGMHNELQRRSAEVERLANVLRESGMAHGEAVGQVSSLTSTHGRQTHALQKEIAELRLALEVERKRAANRAARAASAEAALRRARDPAAAANLASTTLLVDDGDVGGGGAGFARPVDISDAANGDRCGGDCHGDVDFGSGRALDFELPPAFGERPGAVAPSASVAAMASAAECERIRRMEAETAASRAAREHADEVSGLRAQTLALEGQVSDLRAELDAKADALQRVELELQISSGSSGARSALRTLERQLSEQRERAAAAEAAGVASVGRLRQVLASVNALVHEGPRVTAGSKAAVLHSERTVRATIRELRQVASAAGTDGADAHAEAHRTEAHHTDAHHAEGAPSSPGEDAVVGAAVGEAAALRQAGSVSELEVRRCLECLERRLHATDADSVAESEGGTPVEQDETLHKHALAPLSAFQAQSPPRDRRSSGAVAGAVSQSLPKGFTAGRGSGRRGQWMPPSVGVVSGGGTTSASSSARSSSSASSATSRAATEQRALRPARRTHAADPKRAALASFEERVSRVASAAEAAKAAEFEAALSAALRAHGETDAARGRTSGKPSARLGGAGGSAAACGSDGTATDPPLLEQVGAREAQACPAMEAASRALRLAGGEEAPPSRQGGYGSSAEGGAPPHGGALGSSQGQVAAVEATEASADLVGQQRSPQPLTRAQIKARCMERVSSAVSVTRLEGANATCERDAGLKMISPISPGAVLVSRPSTWAGGTSRLTSAVRGLALGAGSGSASGGWTR